LIFGQSCKTEETSGINIIWENGKAKAIHLPPQWTSHIPKDSLRAWIKISLLNDSSATAILGDYQLKNGVVFEPLIPFAQGMDYTVQIKDKNTNQFHVTAANANDVPEVVSVYPQQDTIPENLLKIYIHFSHPMREGSSAKIFRLSKMTKTHCMMYSLTCNRNCGTPTERFSLSGSIREGSNVTCNRT
jgi:hypothetical protein